MANTIIKWLIGIIFLFFAILAVYAGFRLVTSGGNPSAKQAAKSSFTNAFIGLFIVLAAWILVDTLLRAVLRGGNGEVNRYGPWSVIQCAEQVTPGVRRLAVGDPIYEPYVDDNETITGSTVTNGAGTSVNPVSTSGMTSLRSIGVNVARWRGIDGPNRTDLVHPSVAQAVLSMQNQWRNSHNGSYPFQVTAAYTNGVGHSAGSQHYRGTAVDLQPVPGQASYDQIIQMCRQAGFTFINDERSANHIHCDMR